MFPDQVSWRQGEQSGWAQGYARKLKTYSLSNLGKMSHLIDAFETKALVILEREVEEATEPTG